MKSTEISRVCDGENPGPDQRRHDTSSYQTQIDDINRHLNHFSDQEQPKPLSYTDGIASSSGLSRSEKIRPPDVENMLKSRMGRTWGNELSLAYTHPDFLQTGRGGTYDQAVEYYEKIADDKYSEDTFREIEKMSEEDGRERLQKIFEDPSSHDPYEDASSGSEKNDSDSEFGDERESDIENLANKIAAFLEDPFHKHPKELDPNDIRAHMVDNKLGRKELAYTRKYLEDRGDLNEEVIEKTLAIIEDHYFD